jgi:hypothetical protein
MSSSSLTPEQEREAKQLEANIRAAIDKEVAALASLLVSKQDKDLFGQTEFQVRDLVLPIGAKAYEELLREKKRLCTNCSNPRHCAAHSTCRKKATARASATAITHQFELTNKVAADLAMARIFAVKTCCLRAALSKGKG